MNEKSINKNNELDTHGVNNHQHIHHDETCSCGHDHHHDTHSECTEHDHEHHHEHSHGGCSCGHHHHEAAPDVKTLDIHQKPGLATLYVADMCCAVEGNQAVEALKKLPQVDEVTFNTLNRTVSVKHHASDPHIFIDALDKAGLAATMPESTQHEAGPQPTVLYIAEMCCAVEGNQAVEALKKLELVKEASFNTINRTVSVTHDYTDTAPLLQALSAAGLEARIVNNDSEKVRTRLAVEGLDTEVETELINKALEVLELDDLQINIQTHTVSAVMTREQKRSAIDLISSAGFKAKELKDQSQKGHQIPWKKLAIAGTFALVSEIIELTAGPEYLGLAFAFNAIVLAGLGTYRRGLLAIRHLNFNMNALMSVAVTGALIIGHWPEAAMVMVLFEVSEAIETLSIDRAHKAIRDLLKLTPESATIVNQKGEAKTLDVSDIAVGDTLRVMPGERIALDGIVVEGFSAVNQSSITGESMPVEKTKGDKVFGGTLNQTAELVIQVTSDSQHGLAAKMIEAVEAANQNKAPTERFVDVFAKYYTPSVFAVSLLTAILPPLLMGGEWIDWIYKALVLLVIACPCALVISTPVTIVSGLAVAARMGLIVKGGAYLEEARKLKYIALDKTGTITEGRPQVIAVEPTDGNQVKSLLQVAASLASRSNHPVSAAIARHAREMDVSLLKVSDFATEVGSGTHGKIQGSMVQMLNLRAYEKKHKVSENLRSAIRSYEGKGASVVIISDFFGPMGFIAVSDTLRENAKEHIQALKALGVTPVLLTGDNNESAQHMAQAVGITEVRSQMLPQDKLTAIENMQKEGSVGMVGDGINDAPALARANIGFAMGRQGSDIAVDAADVALMDDDIKKLSLFVKLSRMTHNRLVQNITIALGIKLVFMILAYMGMATMWMAVFADIGTCLIVVAWGLTLLQAGKSLK